MNHLYQTDGYNCGATCIKMLTDHYSMESPSIEEIAKICETDETGACDLRMKKGLEHVGLQYEGGEGNIEQLKGDLSSGYKIILRTLTKGIKHWIVVYDYVDNMFVCNDPWLGRIKYTGDELIKIWKPRNFYYFKIQNKLNSLSFNVDTNYWKKYLDTFISHFLNSQKDNFIFGKDEFNVIKVAIGYVDKEIPEEVKEDEQFQSILKDLRNKYWDKFHKNVFEDSDMLKEQSQTNLDTYNEMMKGYNEKLSWQEPPEDLTGWMVK